MSSFAELWMSFTTDYLMWVQLYNGVLCLLVAGFFLFEPVGCSRHNPFFHRLLSMMFVLFSFSFLDRFWNRGLALWNGNVIGRNYLIDSEIGVALGLSLMVFVVAYDYYKNKTRLSMKQPKRLLCDEPCQRCPLSQ